MDKRLKQFQKSFNGYYSVINKFAPKTKKETQLWTMKCFLSVYTKQLEEDGKTRHFINKFIMRCLSV